MTTEQLKKLDQIIMDVESIHHLAINDSIEGKIYEVIVALWKWRDRYSLEKTDDD